MSRCSAPLTPASDGLMPGVVALVESSSSRSTPESPKRDIAGRSVGRRSGGSWSSLMSPVIMTVWSPTWMTTPRQSGIEWLTAKYSVVNAPKVLRPEASTSTNFGLMRCSRHLAATSASVNGEPTTGMSGRSLSRNGMAPMWSS